MSDQLTATLHEWPCPICGTLIPVDAAHQCAAPDGATQPDPPRVTINPIGALGALIGTTLGDRYEILSLLGRGGMGVVFKSRHVVLGNPLAVKILLQPQNLEAQRRFLLEA